MALALARDTQVPPFFIPRDDEASTQAPPQSPREVISGDAWQVEVSCWNPTRKP